MSSGGPALILKMINPCARDCQPDGAQRRASAALSPGRQPFLYFATGLVSGILMDRWAEPPRWVFITLTAASILLSIKFIAGKKSAAATISLIIAFAAIGALLSAGERNGVSHSRLKHLFDEQTFTPDDPVEITGLLQSPPEPAPGAYYLDLESEKLRLRDEDRQATGRVR